MPPGRADEGRPAIGEPSNNEMVSFYIAHFGTMPVATAGEKMRKNEALQARVHEQHEELAAIKQRVESVLSAAPAATATPALPATAEKPPAAAPAAPPAAAAAAPARPATTEKPPAAPAAPAPGGRKRPLSPAAPPAARPATAEEPPAAPAAPAQHEDWLAPLLLNLLAEYREQETLPDVATFLAPRIQAAHPNVLTTADMQLKKVPESILEALVQAGSYHVGPNEKRSGRLGALAKALGQKLDNIFDSLAADAALVGAPVCGYCEDRPCHLECIRESCKERPHHHCFIRYCEQRGLGELGDARQPGYCPGHAYQLHEGN